ncbi:glycosyltransferase family 39 protein [Polyangium sp. 6x1]|uniref:glycosyltransferase family 39 protein n=1 Tax=Polyangium sp. 6x1 TaxID=3042689 RepID=UPI002482D608|nr:glycosyltransferase family 39 protein [Polyangium sp. 6x1]MDI1447453.1 glycosyltransferase family 39 protein [Polyangium sp. 6x1]
MSNPNAAIRRGHVLVLLAAIVMHAALFLPPALRRRDILHDEAITLLVITGHQAAYDRTIRGDAPPHHAWAPAGEWKRLLTLEPDRPPTLGQIGAELGALDIHPPAYFWLGSLVARAFGATVGVVLGLNLFLDTLTLVALFFLAKWLSRDARVGAVAASLWALSPGPLEASLEMRQYALLGLVMTVFALLASMSLDAASPRRPAVVALLLVMVSGIGVATHYHFVLALGAGLVVAAVSLGRKEPRRALLFASSLTIGATLGLLAHPHVFEVLKRQGEQAQRFAPLDIPVRIGGVFVGMGRFFVWSVPLVVAWMITLVVALVLAIRAPKGSLVAILRPFEPRVLRALALLGLTFGGQVALFLAFRSPAGAMRAKYLALDYPLFACVLAWALLRPTLHRRVQQAVVAVVVVSSTVLVVDELWRAREVEASMSTVTPARRMVLDSVARGSLPLALWNVPAEMPVFAASPADLVAHASDVAAAFEPGTLLVLDPRPEAAERRATLLRLVPACCRAEELHPAVFRGRATYQIVPR